ncbi:hypothetical protein D3C78_1364520 [compost metagenome]
MYHQQARQAVDLQHPHVQQQHGDHANDVAAKQQPVILSGHLEVADVDKGRTADKGKHTREGKRQGSNNAHCFSVTDQQAIVVKRLQDAARLPWRGL